MLDCSLLTGLCQPVELTSTPRLWIRYKPSKSHLLSSSSVSWHHTSNKSKKPRNLNWHFCFFFSLFFSGIVQCLLLSLNIITFFLFSSCLINYINVPFPSSNLSINVCNSQVAKIQWSNEFQVDQIKSHRFYSFKKSFRSDICHSREEKMLWL